MSLLEAVKEIEPRAQIIVSASVAADLKQVVADWKAKNTRAPSALETNLIRERLDKALEPANFLRDPRDHIKAWVIVEGKDMHCWFTVAAKRVALIEVGTQPS